MGWGLTLARAYDQRGERHCLSRAVRCSVTTKAAAGEPRGAGEGGGVHFAGSVPTLPPPSLRHRSSAGGGGGGGVHGGQRLGAWSGAALSSFPRFAFYSRAPCRRGGERALIQPEPRVKVAASPARCTCCRHRDSNTAPLITNRGVPRAGPGRAQVVIPYYACIGLQCCVGPTLILSSVAGQAPAYLGHSDRP